MPDFAKAIIARIAAVAVAGLTTFLAGTLGLEVTPEAQTAITDAITMIGAALFLLTYGAIRPLISKYLHPADTSGTAHTSKDAANAG